MAKRQKDSWDKAFEELTFTDDYIFKLVMEQPEIFKAVLALILPTIEVEKLTSLETEKRLRVAKSRVSLRETSQCSHIEGVQNG